MCDFTCTKYVVFVFNFLFFLIGLIILSIGAWAAADSRFLQHLGVDQMDQMDSATLEQIVRVVSMFGIALVILGGIVLVIGFFGCCGAIRENQCCLGIFFFLLFICFIVTVAIGGVLIFIAVSATENETLEENFKSLSDQIWNAMGSDQKQAFEEKYKCCGSAKKFDLNSFNGSNLKCAGKDYDTLVNAGFANKGCMDHLIESVKNNILLAGAVMLGIAFIEILGMSMACVLCCGIKRAYAAV